MFHPFQSAAGPMLAAALTLTLAAVPRSSPAPSPVTHGNALAGVVTLVNQAARMFTVRAQNGRSTTLRLTGATRISGGKLEPSRYVQVRWMEVKGKPTATSIAISPAVPPASKTPSPRS